MMNIQGLWNGAVGFQQNFLQQFQQNGMKNVVSLMQNNIMSRQQTPQKAPENLVRAPAAVVGISSFGMSKCAGGARSELNNCQSWIVDNTAKGEGTAIELNWDEIRLIKYDTTEGDAIRNQMQQTASDNSQIKLDAPGKAALDAYREVLREQGGNREIDFNRIALDLMFEGSGVGSKEITNRADYFASRYVAVKSKIEGNFTGDELTSRLERLDKIYDYAVEKMAVQYSKSAGRFYEENGFNGETEKFYQSVKLGVTKRRDELMQFVAENRDYAGLVGSKDEWLLQDDAYMATQLRAAASPIDAIAPKPSIAEPTTNDVAPTDENELADTPYSLRDLDAAAKFAEELPDKLIGGVHSDEERFGLDFAILTIKTQAFTQAANISDKMQNLIKSSVQNYQQNALNAIDVKLLLQSQDDTLQGNAEGCPLLDRAAIKNVYDKTMEGYEKTGSFEEALKTGGEYGYQKYMEKCNSTDYNKAYRYDKNEYWNAFYTPIKAVNPYYGKVPTSMLYRQNMNEMIQSLQSGNISNFRLGLSGLGAIPNAAALSF